MKRKLAPGVGQSFGLVRGPRERVATSRPGAQEHQIAYDADELAPEMDQVVPLVHERVQRRKEGRRVPGGDAANEVDEHFRSHRSEDLQGVIVRDVGPAERQDPLEDGQSVAEGALTGACDEF